MYSMVLMAAMLPSGDTAAFGGKSKGGCTGAVAASGCHGSSNSCHGGGFLGLKDKMGSSCHGGGFLGGLHKSKGSCHGTPAPAPCGCCGSGAAAVPPPVDMPKPKVDPKPKVNPKTGD